MTDSIDVNQKAIGTQNTQIAEQNNFYGMDAQEASSLALKLFTNNFPKLEAQAIATAMNRVDEFLRKLFPLFSEKGIINFNAFKDPDVQCVLWHAERDYARLGTQELLDILSSLIVQRVEVNTNDYQKIVIDRATEVVRYLSPQHIDYLSALFVCKNLKWDSVKALDDLKLKLYSVQKCLEPGGNECESLLKSLGCLDFNIGYVRDKLAETYGFSANDVANICPKEFASLSGDYTTSHIGSVLAITNLHNKTLERFNIEKWLQQ